MEHARFSPEWQVDAACRGVDPEIFFPGPDEEHRVAAALSVCASCPVRPRCLAFALSREQRYGIWGGLTEKQRRRLSPDERERILRAA